MKKLSIAALVVFLFSAFNLSAQDKLVSEKTHIKFFSTTPAEDIESHNYTSVSTITKSTGKIVFSVPIQSFEFEKSLMQKHFNAPKVLDSRTFPKAKLVGTITNIDAIDFSSDGTYDAIIEGELTLKGVTKKINEKGTITVKGGEITANSVFDITLADYEIEFAKGKMASNVAKTVEVTVVAIY